MTSWDLLEVVDAMKRSDRITTSTARSYRYGVRRLHEHLGRNFVTPLEVTVQMLEEFELGRLRKGDTACSARVARQVVPPVVKFADSKLLPEISRMHTLLKGKPRFNFADAKQEGTLEWYLVEHYFPSKTKIASVATERLYGMVMSRFSKFLGRPAVLTDLDDLTIGKWVRSMRQEEPRLSARTINGNLDKLRAFWNWLAKKRFVEQFPTIENIPEPHKIPRCWLEHEMRAIFTAADTMPGFFAGVPGHLWWRAFVLLAWDTGERTSAILALRWEHFDSMAGTMEAPAEIRKGGRKPMLYRLKLQTVASIEAVRHDGERIFPCPKKNFYREYQRLLRLAGLPYEKHKSGPQKIRRTFASFIEAGGGNASDALAHTMRRVTTGSYLDPRVTETKSPNVVLFELDESPRAPEGWID